MGDELKLLMGPVSVGAAGTHQFIYKHPEKASPSMIDCIQAEISAGTQTGVVAISWGNAVGMTRMLIRGTFTANEPCVSFNPRRVLYPGQLIQFDFSNVTAADTVQASIGGH